MQTLLRPPYFFLVVWLSVFVVYLPAARAGFVSDYLGWLLHIKSHNFIDFVNRSGNPEKSFYQVTQVFTWLFYQVLGTHAWLWHLLFITLQSVNALLFYLLLFGVFTHTGIRQAKYIAAASAMLFSICPHISEVIVWEPSYHYLQGFAFILAILLLTVHYLQTPRLIFALAALLIFFISTFSLEVFYLSPGFIGILLFYYRYALQWPKANCKKAFYILFLPSVLLLILYFLRLHSSYGSFIAHVDSATEAQPISASLGKPAKYLLRAVLLARFWPDAARIMAYDFSDSLSGILLFYSLLVVSLSALLWRLKKLNPLGKAFALLYAFSLLSLTIIVPLWFQDSGIVVNDRHAYIMYAFTCSTIVLALCNPRMGKWGLILLLAYTCLNIRYTIRVNRYWMKSEHLIHQLLFTFPKPEHKITLLLNPPQNMLGVPMIGAMDEGATAIMLQLFRPGFLNVEDTVLDIAAMNITKPDDGVHVKVISDSELVVTANQWGTWWFYNGCGCSSRQNNWYGLQIGDGHMYTLTLHRPATQFQILFQTAGQWKKVDWNNKLAEQY